MSLLEPRDYYKPFRYPWAYQAYKTMQSLHWLPHEAPMAEDVKDWAKKLTAAEKNLLTQLFRFFTQADVDVARGYFEKYGPRFPHPEVRMMLGSFIAAEANHIDAYATLIDTLNMPELEFKAFLDFQAMREKHEYMFESTQGKGKADLAVDIAVFSAFGEGMQLFSSFAILMSFQRRGLMKGMTTIVEWSIRDETLHVESMIRLFRELISENPRIWNDETKQRIYQACRDMVKLEDKFIDLAFKMGEVEGITAAEAKKYIRYIADRRLMQLGLKANYHVKENPFDWLDWIMNAPTHTNFFEGRATEYSKGETPGWERAFNFLDRRKAAASGCDEDGVCSIPDTTVRLGDDLSEAFGITPKYRIYAKPGCPYCDKAKALFEANGYKPEYIVLNDAEDRMKKFIQIEETTRLKWNTSPMIFSIEDDGKDGNFIGGYTELVHYLAQS